MKSKNTAYFLIIGSLIWILLGLNSFIFNLVGWDNNVKSGSLDFLLSMLEFLLQNASPVGFAWIGFSLLKQGKFSEKKIGIVFAILGGLLVLLRVYYNIAYFSPIIFRENPLGAILNYLMVFFSLSVLLFWLMFWKGKIEKGAAWLLAGAVFSSIYSFSSKIFLIAIYVYSGNPFRDQTWLNFTTISGMIDILYPLALVIFAFFVLKEYRHQKNMAFTQKHADQEELLDGMVEDPAETKQKEEKIPSVLDWLSDFLLTLIPLFGLGFLVWRGQNNADRHRRNWAIATLFWTVLGFIFISYFYAPIWQRFERDGMITVILLILILTILCIAVGLAGRATRNDADLEEGDTDVPSILTWFGRGFVLSIPLVGLILLIVWVVDEEDQARKKWAVANLIRMAVMLVYYISMYVTFLNMVKYMSAFSYLNF